MGERPADSDGSSESGKTEQSGENSPAESASSPESRTSEPTRDPSGNTASSEENPDMIGPINPSHNIQNSLMAAVAEYYAAGNWIPDLSFALPADFSKDILGNSLSGYWGKESWSESDHKDFVDIIIGGWKNLMDKDNTAVG